MIPDPFADDADTPSRYPTLLLTRHSDTQILGLLQSGVSLRRITAIGAYRRAWTPTDVQRVADAWTGVLTPNGGVVWRPTGFHGDPHPLAPARDVELTMRQAEVLDGLCRGYTVHVIADDLGIPEHVVRCAVKGVLRQVRVFGVETAVEWAKSGQVRLFVVDSARPRRTAA